MSAKPSHAGWLNLGIAFTTALLFLVFAFWHRMPWLQPAAPETLARMISGEGLVRTHETEEFQPGSLRMELHHQDAIWVPAGKKAEMELYDGKRLVLQEKTLLILRKPFIAPYDGEEESLPFRVVQGRVEATNFKAPERALDRMTKTPKEETPPAPVPSDSTEPPPSPSGNPEPQPSIVASPAPRRTDVHPRDGGTVLVTTGTATRITFSWPEAVTGKLELLREDSQEPQEIALTNVRHQPVDITLDPGGLPIEFKWSVLKNDGSRVTGPHSLTVQKLSREKMSEMLLRANEPDSMIYIQ
jgi:hypothetical protein